MNISRYFVCNMALIPAAKFLIFTKLFSLALGYQLYDKDLSICCKGVVHPLLIDSTFDPNNPYYRQICCGTELITYPPEDELKLAKLNNDPISICCNEKIKNITNETMCCGDEIITKRDFSCYDDSIKIPITRKNFRENKRELCGDDEMNLVSYNSKTQLCCGSKVEEANDPDEKCCASKMIDLNTQICCQEYYFEDDDFEYEGMDVQQVIVPLKGRDRVDTECCSLDLYDKNNQDCINGFLVDKGEPLVKHCCGKTYICNESNADWSMSERSSNVEDEDVCFQLYIYDKHFPCYLNVLHNGENEEEICPNANRTYNVFIQSCCPGPSGVVNMTVEDIKNENYDCCE